MYHYLWYFMLYAVVGWGAEVIFTVCTQKKFVNRGFFSGPYCPIYGFGVILTLAVFDPYRDSPLLLFFGSLLLTSALEWLTGLFMDKVLHHKLWDYSGSRFHLGGYICLSFSLVWAVGCVFVLKMALPLTDVLISVIPAWIGRLILIIFYCCLGVDAIVSFASVISLNIHFKHLKLIEDQQLMQADDLRKNKILSEKADLWKQKYEKYIKKNGVSIRRLLKAFPDIQSKKYEQQLEQLRVEMRKIKEVPLSLSQKTQELLDRRNQKIIEAYERVIPEEEEKPFGFGLCFTKLFWLFMIGSFLGWILEMVWCIATLGHFEMRVGLVYGPLNPVYGAGAVAMAVCLFKLYKKPNILIFIGSALIGAAVEYLCSLGQEMIFGTISWEYSGTPFNLAGRTNLKFALMWGALGVIWVKDIYPSISHYIEKIPKRFGAAMTMILCVFMIWDMGISAAAVIRKTERHYDIPASNVIDEYLDEHFPDKLLDFIYPNMKYADE